MLECRLSDGEIKPIHIYALTENDRMVHISGTIGEIKAIQRGLKNENIHRIDLLRDGKVEREMQLIFRSVQTDEDENGSAAQIAFFLVDEVFHEEAVRDTEFR